MLRRILLTFFTVLFTCAAFGASEVDASVCIVSLLPERKIEAILEKRIKGEVLRTWRQRTPRSYTYISNLEGPQEVYRELRNCLEGGFSEAFIVAHSVELIPGFPGIVFPRAFSAGHYQMDFLNDRFFSGVGVSRSLRQITLVGCKPEDVFKNYSKFAEMIDRNHLTLRFAPESPFLNWLNDTEGARDALSLPEMVAEATQPTSEEQFFCLLYRDSLYQSDSSEVSCRNGQFRLKFGGASQLPRGFKWVSIEKVNERGPGQNDYLLKFAAPGSMMARVGARGLRNLVLTQDSERQWSLGRGLILSKID